VVQLLIERGCQYSARNNQGFTASDYAYSYSTRDTLQDTARLQFEINKKSRRNVFAQADERGNEWGATHSGNALPVPPKMHGTAAVPRVRSGSGTSRTTATSDNDSLAPGSSLSASSSPSQLGSALFLHSQQMSGRDTPQIPSASSAATVSASSPTAHGSTLATPINLASALSPIANRMRERDADAREKYMRRNRSESQGTSSTENRSQNGSNFSSGGASVNGDDVSSLGHLTTSGSTTPRRLRPSFSAAQLRTGSNATTSNGVIHTQPESRNRAGTNPSHSPLPLLIRSSSTSTSRSFINADRPEETESYIGPPSQYAQFPDPPSPVGDSSAPIAGRRKAFHHLLSKPLPTIEQPTGVSHRRGMSATSVR